MGSKNQPKRSSGSVGIVLTEFRNEISVLDPFRDKTEKLKKSFWTGKNQSICRPPRIFKNLELPSRPNRAVTSFGTGCTNCQAEISFLDPFHGKNNVLVNHLYSSNTPKVLLNLCRQPYIYIYIYI